MAEDPESNDDKVCINTMLQCDRSDRKVFFLQALNFEFFAVCSAFLATGGVAEYISMFMDLSPHLF